MSDTKFTSGKWSQSHRKDANGMYSTEVYDDRGETICILDWHTEPDSTATDRDANAHLISSAPDMYKMIERVSQLRDLEGDYAINWLLDNTDNLINLLSKARGES